MEETPCARKRSGGKKHKRPRIITIDNVIETLTLTTTTTITESAITTATFSVSVRTSLAGGFFVKLINFCYRLMFRLALIIRRIQLIVQSAIFCFEISTNFYVFSFSCQIRLTTKFYVGGRRRNIQIFRR